MSAANRVSDAHGSIAWPAERFFWQVLPASRERLTPIRLAFRIENALPLPLERCQFAIAALADGRMLAVAIPHDVIAAARADGSLPTSTWRLAPAALPEEVAGLDVTPTALSRINLLCGRHAPTAVRRARRWGGAIASAATLMLAIGMLAHGWRVRSQGLAIAETAAAEIERIATAALPPAEGAERDLPASLRLTQELRRMQAAAGITGTPLDVVPAAESLFTHWPTDVRVQIQSLTIDGARISIRGVAVDTGQAQAFADALRDMRDDRPAWNVRPLSLNQSGEGTRFSCQLSADGTQP